MPFRFWTDVILQRLCTADGSQKMLTQKSQENTASERTKNVGVARDDDTKRSRDEQRLDLGNLDLTIPTGHKHQVHSRTVAALSVIGRMKVVHEKW